MLASSLASETLDLIFVQCLDDSALNGLYLSDQDTPEDEDRRLTRRTLFASLFVCQRWYGAARRRLRKHVPPVVTSKSQAQKVMKALTPSNGPHWTPTTLELKFPHLRSAGRNAVFCFCRTSIPDVVQPGPRDVPVCLPKFGAGNIGLWGEYAILYGHKPSCYFAECQQLLVPRPSQIAELLTMCSSLTRLVLGGVDWYVFLGSRSVMEALRQLSAVEEFTCSGWAHLTTPPLVTLLSSWPRIRSFALLDLDQGERRYPWAGHNPVIGSIPSLRDLKLVYTLRYDGPANDIDVLLGPNGNLHTLSIVVQKNKFMQPMSAVTYSDQAARLPLTPSLFKSLRCLTFDASRSHDMNFRWNWDHVRELLGRCMQLSELTIGPSPPLCESLLVALPRRLSTVTIILEQERLPPSADPDQAVDTLCNSPSLQAHDVTVNVQIPLLWPLEDDRYFLRKVTRRCKNLGRVTKIRNGSLQTIYG